MIYVWIILFLLAILLCWLANVLGFPGNWCTALLIGIWMWVGPVDPPFQIGWPILVVILVLALAAELVELGASMLGAKKFGGSKRGAWLSLLGSIIGGFAGAVIGFPIPILGWIVGSLVFACIGALVGAFLGEKWAGKTTQESLEVGGIALAGRFFGTAAKIVVGSVVAIVATASLFF